MALRLRVVSDQRRWLGSKSTIVFGVAGGTIGRSTENDWVLPDPERYVSGRHARVIFTQGGFYLTDVSTNGTFVNDVEAAVGPQAPYELKNGDVLRLGEYHIVVALDSATDFAPDDSGLLDTASSADEAGTPTYTQGSGSTHAWLQAYLPGAGWVPFDPTNNLRAGTAQLIRVGVARDPRQAAPISGSWFGPADAYLGLTATVQVSRVTL